MMNRRFLMITVLYLLAASNSMGLQAPLDDTDVKLLVNGKAAFDEIIDNIRSASESIFINMFIWRDDRIGNRIALEVLEAAERGVRIHISKDLYSVLHEYSEESKLSFFHKDAPRALRLRSRIIEHLYPEQGVDTTPGQQPSELLQSLLTHKNITLDRDTIKRDHSKYFIFDDRILIMGGVNIEDKEFYRDILGKRYFDYMVRLDGAHYVEAFYQDMHAPVGGDRPVQFIHNRRDIDRYCCKAGVLDLLDAAQSSIVICNAYWGDVDVLNKVIAKANQGVKVSVFIAAQSNIKNDLNHKMMKTLYEATHGRVHIYRSTFMLHAKAMVCDNAKYLIGSSNLNKSSFNTYSEANVLLYNPPDLFQESFAQSLADLKAHSQRVTSSDELTYNRRIAWLEGMQESQYGIPLAVFLLGGMVCSLLFACCCWLRKTFTRARPQISD